MKIYIRKFAFVLTLLLLVVSIGCNLAEPATTATTVASSPSTALAVTSTSVFPTAEPSLTFAPTSTPVTAIPTFVPTAVPSLASAAGPAIEAPQGEPPVLDGVVSPGEWDSALRQEFTDGGELFVMQNDRYLYLGVHENFDGLTVTSVCLEHEGTISILHSSGSLGTAIFERGDDAWQLIQPFEWELYGVTSNTAAAEEQRQAFLNTNGWLANLGSMTDTEEIEYQIALPDGPFHIAVAYLRPPNFSQAAWWPAELADDCRKIDLLQANIAESSSPALKLQFSPETWASVSTTADSVLGGQIAYVSDRPGRPQLYLMNTDGSNQQILLSSKFDDYAPSWSPDGTKLAFYRHFSWQYWAIMVVNADGSDLRQLTDNTQGATCSFGPVWSPDGKQIAFTIEPGAQPTCEMKHTEIAVMGADGKNMRFLTNNDSNDLFSGWSPDGAQMIFVSNRDGSDQIYIMNDDGSNPQRLTELGSTNYMPSISHDGRFIAFVSNRDGNDEIYVMGVDGSNLLRLTNNPANDWQPGWSADGKQIVFVSSSRGGSPDIYVMDSDGSNTHRLTEHPRWDFEPAWQPALTETSVDGLSQYAFPPSIDPAQRYLFYLHGKIIEDQGLPAISPDFGEYEYAAILKKLSEYGFVVLSEQRPKDTDALEYARKVVGQVRKLLDAGVPASSVTVAGASKGSFIAIHVSHLLENRTANFVLLGSCGPDVESFVQNQIFLYGNVLSIYDSVDTYAGSCKDLFLFSEGKGISEYNEIVLNVGTGHGILYKPLDEWIVPVVEWARKERSGD